MWHVPDQRDGACHTCGNYRLKAAVGNLGFEDGGGADGFELFHNGEGFAAADHDFDGAPVGIFQRIDGGGVVAGGDLLRFGQARTGNVILQK